VDGSLEQGDRASVTVQNPDHLELAGVRKSFGGSIAVDGLTLSVGRGERVALLGASGCGKTTTLNMIAGFLIPDTGAIHIDGRDITDLPAHRRNTGMVFQQYALFPHMSVANNVGFGLRMRGVPRADLDRRVAAVLALVRLQDMADRLPRQLSGGQQQRVALARALVVRPNILLLDEPLSNLDAKLRHEMRTEMLGLLDSIGLTTILVTHDQEEALALADRLAVMNLGRIEQIGTPSEVFETPATAFVAKFLGEPNVLSGRVVEMNGTTVVCDVNERLRIRGMSNTRIPEGTAVDILVRPERVYLTAEPMRLDNSASARIEHTVYLGDNIRYIVRVDDKILAAVENNQGQQRRSNASGRLTVQWAAKDTLVFPAEN
jgi:putative spermidine/putrescine transport system ATP-binding protein